MKLTIRHAHEEWREPIEKETHRQAAKLDKLLKSYAPDLVQLHAAIEKHARKESYYVYRESLASHGHASRHGRRLRRACQRESGLRRMRAVQETPGALAQGL